MHSLKEIMENLANDRIGFCSVVENNGVICWNKKYGTSKKCCKHLNRWRKYKSHELPLKNKKVCKFIGCKNKHRSKGYCQKHYSKFWHKERRKSKNHKFTDCIVVNCIKKNVTKGYCNAHYMKFLKYGNAEHPSQKSKKPWNAGMKKHKCCIVPGCGRNSENHNKIVKGLCVKHYERWRKFKDYNVILKRGVKPNHVL